CHGHRARIQAAEEAHRPVYAVVHQKEHALFAANSECPQAVCKAAHLIGELAVAERADIVEVGGTGSARSVSLDQMLGEVEALWRRLEGIGDAVAHLGSPRASFQALYCIFLSKTPADSPAPMDFKDIQALGPRSGGGGDRDPGRDPFLHAL